MNAEHLLETHLIPWIQDWGYLAIFFGIMAENAGIPAPGELIIIGGSVMAGKGASALTGVAVPPLAIQLVYLWAVAGAIVGDNIGYWVGATGGRALFLKLGRFFRVKEAKLDEAEKAFIGRSDWAVFFGRFVTILRIFAGPLAGMVHMPYHRFVFFNALGALIWVGMVCGISYALSEELDLIIKILHNLGTIGLGVFTLIVGLLVWRRMRRGT